MIEGEKKGETSCLVFFFFGGVGKWGGVVFSTGPPFKRKKFSPQFREKTREKSGREWV